MFLGIEIGGTKLQLGVGSGLGPPLVARLQQAVPPRADAEWIRNEICRLAAFLLERYPVQAVGIGFGGPVEYESGSTIISHQVPGWERFPLRQWAQSQWGRPVMVANDADSAGLAEAIFGAGRGRKVVFYTNVGSGIGGALVFEGRLFCGGSGVAAEIGHLRPGLQADSPDKDVESLASGWAIARGLREKLRDSNPETPEVADLLARCGHRVEKLDTRTIAEAARNGNRLAQEAFEEACRVYGWAIAQMVTLIAPNVVVVGGGVSLAGEEVWFTPLRRYVDQYVFPQLRGRFEIVPAALGEEVVVHGAIALAREANVSSGNSVNS